MMIVVINLHCKHDAIHLTVCEAMQESLFAWLTLSIYELNKSSCFNMETLVCFSVGVVLMRVSKTCKILIIVGDQSPFLSKEKDGSLYFCFSIKPSLLEN